jgi:hypothetical protein
MKRWDYVDQNDWKMEWGDIESKKIEEHLERMKDIKGGCIRRNWLSAASASS